MPPLNLQKVQEQVQADSRINRMKNLLMEAKRKIEGPLLSPKILEQDEDVLLIKSETERLKSQRQSQTHSRQGIH